MAKILLLLVLVCCISFVLWRRLGSPGFKSTGNSPGQGMLLEPDKTGPYSTIAVISPMDACKAALQLRDRKIPASEAPSLPLAECDLEQCNCQLQVRDDRRQQDRRRPAREEHKVLLKALNSDRRESSDRRQETSASRRWRLPRLR